MSDHEWDVYEKLDDIGVVEVDSDGNILKCNAAFSELFEDAPMHLVGKSVIDLTSPEDRGKARKNLQWLFEGTVESIKHQKHYALGQRRMLQTFYHPTPVPHLLSFVYESEDQSLQIRVRELEQLHLETLRVLTNKTSEVNVTMNDASQHASADRGGRASVSSGLSGNAVIAIFLAVALVLTAAVTMFFGGQSTIQYDGEGGTKVQIEGQ